MINDNTVVTVRNMTDQGITYIVPELNVRRRFSAFESKKVNAKELRQLWYLNGGARLLQDYLAVESQELAQEFGVSEDVFTHEYSWTQKDIDDALQNGSIELLEDVFDFAPLGICETIVSEAIRLKIPDRNKHNLIHDVTGRDISKMIQYKEELEKLNQDDNTTQRKTRRVGGNNSTRPTSGRRVS